MSPSNEKRNQMVAVSDSSKTASSLVFSKQEMLELADYLRYAHESIGEYARETSARHGNTLPMVHTLRAYAERAATLRARIESAAR